MAPQLADLELPAGYRPVVEQAEARAMWDLVPAVAGILREDSRQTRHAVWQAVCDLWSDTGVVTATQEAIAERASARAGYRVARQTAGNHLRALLTAGVLWQSQTMRGVSAEALGTDTGRAGSYVVMARLDVGQGDGSREDVEDAQASPVVDELGHLPERSSSSLLGVGTTPRIDGDFFPPNSDTSENPHRDVMGDATAQRVLGRSGEESWLTQRAQNPELYSPRTTDERQQGVLWIIAVMGWGDERDAERELGKITRPFFAAGWSPKAIVHALEHRPGEGSWPCSLPAPHQRDSRNAPRPRSLWAVLTWRLREWRAANGTPVTPPVEVLRPRRGRPSGAVSRRRALVEQFERMPNGDRRTELHAALTGIPAPTRHHRGAGATSLMATEMARINARRAQAAAELAEREAAQAAFEAELFSPTFEPEPDEADQLAAAEAERAALAAAVSAQRMARAQWRARTERATRTRP